MRLLLAWLVLSVSAEEVNIRRWPLGRLGMALLVGIGLAGTVLLVAGAMIAPWDLCLPMVLVAIVVAAGTLLGLSWFQQGATERAVYSLAATWTLVLLVVTAMAGPDGRAIPNFANGR